MAETMVAGPGTGRPGRKAATSWWLIAGEGQGRLEMLTVGLGGGTLPVFGFREEAELYLGASRRTGWRVRETSCEELVSLLYGPCRSVGSVALDPVPGMAHDRTLGLVSLDRERFVGFVMDRAARGGASGRRRSAAGPRHGRGRRDS